MLLRILTWIVLTVLLAGFMFFGADVLYSGLRDFFKRHSTNKKSKKSTKGKK